MLEQQQEVSEEAPLFIRWNPDRSPYAIELKLDLVSEIAEEILRARESGHEIGGLLYGTIPVPGLPVLRVEDFLPVPGRPEDGRIYMLDPRQQDIFAEARWGNKKPGKTAIGFFRSNLRGGLLVPSLTDRGLVSSQFKEGIAPMLLVEANEPRSAAFFLARNGQLPDEPSVPEFRLDDREFRSLPEIEPTPAPESSPKIAAPSAFNQYAWAGALAAILVVVIAAVLWLGGRWGASDRLDLRVTGPAQALAITWNHSTSQIEQATDGTLTVTDGGGSREYRLDRDELMSGTIQYRTNSPQLRVALALNMPGSISLIQSVNWRAE